MCPCVCVRFCWGECGTLLGQNVLYLKAYCYIDHIEHD